MINGVTMKINVDDYIINTLKEERVLMLRFGLEDGRARTWAWPPTSPSRWSRAPGSCAWSRTRTPALCAGVRPSPPSPGRTAG